jgi:hypothetical protein
MESVCRWPWLAKESKNECIAHYKSELFMKIITSHYTTCNLLNAFEYRLLPFHLAYIINQDLPQVFVNCT